MKISSYLYPLSVFTSTIIGAGIFSLPYISLKAGIFLILGYFFILGIIAILIHLFYGEIALNTPDYKRLPGIGKVYFGEKGKKFALLIRILGLFGVILIYLIIGGEFLNFLFNLENPLLSTLIYFTSGAFLIFLGIKAIAKIEFFGLVLFFLIVFLIFLNGFSQFDINFLFLRKNNFENWFLPYGPILFSIWGAVMIPEIEEMLKEKKKALNWIVPISILISILFYLFFIFTILGISKGETTQNSIVGLEKFLSPLIFKLALFFAILTTFTSFISLGLNLKKIFWYDFNLEKNLSWALTCFPPLFLFLVGFKDFIKIISFVGGVAIGLEGIFILLIYWKLKKRKFVFPFILIFIFAIIYEIFHL